MVLRKGVLSAKSVVHGQPELVRGHDELLARGTGPAARDHHRVTGIGQQRGDLVGGAQQRSGVVGLDGGHRDRVIEGRDPEVRGHGQNGRAAAAALRLGQRPGEQAGCFDGGPGSGGPLRVRAEQLDRVGFVGHQAEVERGARGEHDNQRGFVLLRGPHSGQQVQRARTARAQQHGGHVAQLPLGLSHEGRPRLAPGGHQGHLRFELAGVEQFEKGVSGHGVGAPDPGVDHYPDHRLRDGSTLLVRDDSR
jgi:hypothetical protein